MFSPQINIYSKRKEFYKGKTIGAEKLYFRFYDAKIFNNGIKLKKSGATINLSKIN